MQDDLAEARAQIQPLQDDREVAEETCAEVLAYAEYLDIVLYPIWREAEIIPCFEFEDDLEWMMELKSRTDDMGDTELSNYFKALKGDDEVAMNLMWYHCLNEIEEMLK